MPTHSASSIAIRLIAAAALVLPWSAGSLHAQVTIVPTTPQVGSSNPATAEPLVPRPTTKPCVVQLFQDMEFDNYTPQSFSYTPPADCPGPWAKVVFTADFTVTAGTQFDRTGAFYLGHANLWYGTTAEPRTNLSPSWHVERDVTDLSAIFQASQTGEANLGNYVGVYDGVNYNGIIYANAALEFYPANIRNPAPRTPDIVVPVNGPGGDAGTLNTGADQITQALDLPRNVENAYLDVIAQNQIGDEFWYFCVPNDQTANLESCGNTAFREVEVSIDGQPAGVAPAYPWIFTGGIDPFLWEPIPAVQTLDLAPYRVDLSPFAGLLSDGSTHTVAVSVYNANGYFLATANLLVYTDHGSKSVSGGLISSTLSAAPNPSIQENITSNNGTYTGNILTTSNRSFAIRGYVNTSHGRVDTTVQQSVGFSNNQEFIVSATQDEQNVQQLSTVSSTTTTRDGPFVTTAQRNFRYPLNIDYNFVVNSDGSADQYTTVQQGWTKDEAKNLDGFPIEGSNTSNSVNATDTLQFNASGDFIGNVNSRTTGTYTWKDSSGGCYSRTISAAAQALTGVKDGQGCGGGPWF
ncbi:MAG TPA: peptide-N4-asparagine amidase [Acidobacteriaceae bacterium]|nr:peptide-N4-asparagine amidase [Acidobacteriaceae bacterium]